MFVGEVVIEGAFGASGGLQNVVQAGGAVSMLMNFIKGGFQKRLTRAFAAYLARILAFFSWDCLWYLCHSPSLHKPTGWSNIYVPLRKRQEPLVQNNYSRIWTICFAGISQRFCFVSPGPPIIENAFA